MKTCNKFGAAMALALAALPAAAWAQTTTTSVPNYGDYQARTENFRVGIRATNVLANTVVSREAAFGQSTIQDITDYLDPSEIAGYLGTFYSNQTGIAGIFDLRGVPVFAGYQQGSNILTVVFRDPKSGAVLTDASGGACAFTYNGASRQQAFDRFDADTDDGGTATSRSIAQCLSRAWARYSPVDPLVGNPYALQESMSRSALDLTEGDSVVEQQPGANSAGDPWMIGATFATGSASRFDMVRIDARVNKGWRVFEGNRARLKLDLPFSFTTVKGAAAYSGQIGLGLEVPVKERVWSLEPRVAYGVTYSGDAGSFGHIVQGSVASRLVIRTGGRGYLMIGNLAGYSTTLKTPGDFDINPEINTWLFRNGVAYDLPLKTRMFGRQTSFRASYTFTNYEGAKLYNNNFHEVTFSFGLRGREDTAKAFRDVVRLNLNTIQAKGFSSYTVGLGFRF